VNDEQRIARLAGDTGGGGGGIPLPPVFGAILEHLQDGRRATSAELREVVVPVLDYKKARVFATWPNWAVLIRDLLAQLEAEGFIAQAEPDFYRATDKVQPGKDLLVIPGKDIHVTVYTAAQRQVRDKLSEVRALAAGGLGDNETNLLLTSLEGSLTGTGPKKRAAHAGSIAPLEDEPGHYRMCTSCKHDFEMTAENFAPFKSHGEWYRNRLCRPCARSEEIRAGKKEMTAIKRAMEKYINEGPLPSVQDVMDHLRLDDVITRKYWDELAALGKVPDRDEPWK
jgi:hypothetical protein